MDFLPELRPPTLAASGLVDDLALEEPVELFGVDPMGSFHLAVEPGSAGFDLDVVDAFVEQVPVERGAEL